jgi:hypothetical protein
MRVLKSLIDFVKKIDWREELVLVLVGSILGGLIFTFVSPFIVPAIHDFQVNHLNAQNPDLGVEVRYAENVSGSTFNISDNETYHRYQIEIHNPTNQMLNTITVGLAFPGGIKNQSVGHFQPMDSRSYSRNAYLAQTESPNNTALITNAIIIPQLPPGKTVTATFLIDQSLEKRPIPGYWDTAGLEEYNASTGSIMISGHYRWDFKGQTYSEEERFTYVDASQRASPGRFDVCIGAKNEEYCAT